MENERQIQKLKLIIADYQQNLANRDLNVADLTAEIQLLRAELAEKDQKIVELQDAAEGKKVPTAVRKAS